MWTIEFREHETAMWESLQGRFKDIDLACQHAKRVFKDEYLAALFGEGPVLVRIAGPHYGSNTC